MLSYILQKIYSILGWKENIPLSIGIHEKLNIYKPLPSFIFNDKCTKNIGCRYHRDWDFCRVKTLFYNPPGFSSIYSSKSNYGKENASMSLLSCKP